MQISQDKTQLLTHCEWPSAERRMCVVHKLTGSVRGSLGPVGGGLWEVIQRHWGKGKHQNTVPGCCRRLEEGKKKKKSIFLKIEPLP